ncbi:MAG: hypothetical protein QN131_05310 [Armatimonadota bacterium]|nr:hypothetical protein [Armatimonadota bacterium]MDR7549345.1 hypothetical protein [Armatimonadota bacterium]
MPQIGVLAAVVLGAVAAWEGRFDMDPDGVSYLDIADAYARADWQNALNAVWSPLYSWILIPFLRGLRPDGYWEFPLVHAVNFLLYIGALAAFAYCLRQIVAYRRWRAAGDPGRSAVPSLPDRVVHATGYAVFVWGCVVSIRVSHVGPHVALAGLTFLITGLLLRLRMHPEEWRSWAALGLALGLTYLARASTLPFVGVFFGLALLRLPAGWLRARVTALRPLLALVVFTLVAGVYAVPLLAVKRQFAGRDLVRLNYAWYVNGVPILHWQGDPPYGSPVHPTRVLFERPTVYEFDGPVGGTYPPWYDPAYWSRGIEPRFSLRGHLWRLRESVGTDSGYHLIPFSWSFGVLAYILAAAFLLRRGLLSWNRCRDYAELQIPALLALVSYPILTILPERFLGAFLPLLWLGTIACVSWPGDRPERARSARAVAYGILVFHHAVSAAMVGGAALKDLVAPSRHMHWGIAQALHSSDIPAGSKVAVMGRARHAHWARLGRMRIVAEIPIRGGAAREFWEVADDRRRELLTRLHAAGVRSVVVDPTARPGPAIPDDTGRWAWRELEGTGYLVLVLR